MFIKTIILSSAILSIQPVANLTQIQQQQNDYLLKELIDNKINISDFNKIALDNQSMTKDIWNKFKVELNKTLLMVKEKRLNPATYNSHIFDLSFWTTEITPSWSWGNLHLSLTNNAVNQFFELSSNGVGLTSAIISAGIALPVWGAVLVAFLAVTITTIKAMDVGRGATIRLTFGFIPSGFWAN